MEDFAEIRKKIESKTEDKKIVDIVMKILRWEKSRIDMDKPIRAVEDFREIIKEAEEK